MSDRVQVIFPEVRESATNPDSTHLGKVGVMTTLDRSTGQASVTFDGDDQAVTIAACCLQYID